MRELQEETGIRANRWRHLLDIHTSNSVTDEVGVVYLAEELQFGENNLDETEQLAVNKVPLKQAVDMALDGRITDAISIAALLKLAVRHESQWLLKSHPD